MNLVFHISEDGSETMVLNYTKVIPNKECILLTQFIENCKFRIRFDSYTADLTNTAEDESNPIRNIPFLINCVNNMHSLFRITFVLFLLKSSAGKGLWS